MDIALQGRDGEQKIGPIHALHTYKLQPTLYQVLWTGIMDRKVHGASLTLTDLEMPCTIPELPHDEFVVPVILNPPHDGIASSRVG